MTIPLDVRLSPSANAQKYFKEYKKKQTAARMLTELIAESDAEAEYLATVQYEVETAEGEAALAEIRAELKSQGYLKYYKSEGQKAEACGFSAVSCPRTASPSWWDGTMPKTTG